MSRLTETYEEHIAHIPKEYIGNSRGYSLNSGIICEKLGAYEDLEEKGLLVILPLKVGDKVYEPRKDRGFISEYEITMITITSTMYFKWMLLSGIYSNLDGFKIDDIGKTVFLTKEEAEKVLEEGDEP